MIKPSKHKDSNRKKKSFDCKQKTETEIETET